MTTTMRTIIGVLVHLLGPGACGTVSAGAVPFPEVDALPDGAAIGIDRATVPVDGTRLATGLSVELEHGTEYAGTDVTGNDPTMTAMIACAHLRDYYYRLSIMEAEAEAEATGVQAIP